MRTGTTRSARPAWPRAPRASALVRGALGFLGAWLIRLVRATWRVEVTGRVPVFGDDPLVFCFWHGRQAGLLAYPLPRAVAVLASRSRDGSIQARILGRLGFSVHRGSSSRGGAAGLKGLIGALEGGSDAVFAVDGPRGPAFRVKPGAAMAAARAGGLLVPVTARASRSWRFPRAWDDYRLPKPFARVEIAFGDPIRVGAGGVEAASAQLEAALGLLDPAPS